MFFIKINLYSQNVEFEDFGYSEDILKCESDNQSNMIENPYAIPQLIPLKNNQFRTPIIMHINKIDKEMVLIVAVNVHFSNNLKKAKNVKVKYVYLPWIKINEDRFINSDCAMEEEDFVIWNTVSEKFINWMYNQAFDDYYNRSNIYPQYKEILGLSFIYKVTILPELQNEH